MFNKPILVIGGGSIGKRHIRNLQALGFKNLYCQKRKKDTSFETEFNVSVITSEIELKEIKPFAVVVCTPTSLHTNTLKLSTSVGAHVFMEKPLTHDIDCLKEAKELLENNNKVFFIGFMMRFHPLVKKIKKIIDSKFLGDVYSARFEFGSYLPYWHPYEDYKISYAARKELGGGVINTITHELDLIQYYFGMPKRVTGSKINLGKLDIDVEELLEGNLIYDDKVVTLHLDYLQKDYDRRISILCDEGSIRWNWHDNKISVQKHKEKMQGYSLANFDVNQLYIDEMKAFFSLIETNSLSHSLDGKHAVENTKITLALHKAGNEKKTINIEKHGAN